MSEWNQYEDLAGSPDDVIVGTGRGLVNLSEVKRSILGMGLYFNVKAYEAKGDGTNDDTVSIQNAVNAAASANGGVVHFPVGTYRITAPILIPSTTSLNIIIQGVGPGTVILPDLPAGQYAFGHDAGADVGGFILRDMDFRPYQTNYDVGAVKITRSLRGISFYNLRCFNLRYSYRLDGQIYAIASFFACKAYLPLTFAGSYGFYLNGNTIHCYGCESVGFEIPVYWGDGTVGSWDGGSIAGSPGFLPRYAVYINNAKHVKLSNFWIEQLDANKEAVKMLNGSVTMENCNVADGSIIVDAGTFAIANSKFNTAAGGIKHGPGAKIIEGDNVVRFDGDHPIYQSFGAYAQGKVIQKPSFDDLFRSTPKGLIENSMFMKSRPLPVSAANGNSSLAEYTTEYFSGDRAMKVTTTAAFGGVRFTITGVVPNRRYTAVARVKILSGATKVYGGNFPATNTVASSEYPAKEHTGAEWGIVSVTLYSTTSTIDGRFITDVAGEFIIDSINLMDGTQVRSPEVSFVGTNQVFLQGRRIEYAAAAPTVGTWTAGDIVFNTAPAAGGKIGWVCTVGGTPGTWKPWGAIDA